MNVDFLKDGALAVAQEQHLQTVMKMIVEGINEETDIALFVSGFSNRRITPRNATYARRLQTKPVACIWSRVPDTY